MFVYTDPPQQLQTSLFTEGCQDYVYVQKTYSEQDPSPLGDSWSARPCLLVNKFRQYAERIRDFKVHSDDIWIVTYPKCGTTWTQEMVWLLANNLDYDTAKATDINQRSPYLEISAIGTNLNFDSLARIEQSGGAPRVIKSHLPLNLLPVDLFRVNPKVIYVTRNAKDTAISYYHHYSMLLGYKGTIDTFLDAFLSGDLIYGHHSRHTEDFLRLRHSKPNVLVLRYEDMKRSMADVLRKTSKFLSGTEIQEPELGALAHHLSFEQMRQNQSCNNETMTKNAMNMNGRKDEHFRFMRKGRVGTYLEEMPPRFVEKFSAAEAAEGHEELRFYIAPPAEDHNSNDTGARV